MTPDEMIARLQDPLVDTSDGKIANDLLDAFYDGYPIENLKVLMIPSAMGHASFIASELGRMVRPLLKEIVGMVSHDRPRVRGDAIDALSQCTTWEDGWAIAEIIKALGDPHAGVLQTAFDALRSIESSKVHAGLEHLAITCPDDILANLQHDFLAIERRMPWAAATLERLMHHEDMVLRNFGAAMVVRPQLCIDPARVALAEDSPHTGISDLISGALGMPLPPGTIWTGKYE